METYQEKMDSNRVFTWGQTENGMYWGEIRDEFNTIESVITCRTLPELYRWMTERI